MGRFSDLYYGLGLNVGSPNELTTQGWRRRYFRFAYTYVLGTNYSNCAIFDLPLGRIWFYMFYRYFSILKWARPSLVLLNRDVNSREVTRLWAHKFNCAAVVSWRPGILSNYYSVLVAAERRGHFE